MFQHFNNIVLRFILPDGLVLLVLRLIYTNSEKDFDIVSIICTSLFDRYFSKGNAMILKGR